MRVADRDADRLDRGEPGRERARVVLQQDGEEPLDGAEQRTVDHDRALLAAVGRRVLQVETLRQVEVELHRGHLPGAADGVLGLDGDLRAVEGGAARVGDQGQALLLGDLAEGLGGLLPHLVGADELLRVLGGQLQVEVCQTVVAQQVEDEGERLVELVGHLLAGAVDVRVVLGEAAGTGQAVHHAGLLVPVHGPELEEAQRQFAVGAAARVEDQVVHRAVHGLQVVVHALVELHGRVHAVGVPVEVPGRLEELPLRGVRGVDELVALLLVAAARVVLHDPAHDAALGVEDGESGADLLGDGEQVEFGAEFAVVALLGLGEEVEVRLQLVPGRPGGAVDALEHRVLLAAAPVGGRVAHQLERRDEAGGGQVGTAAEVLPAQLAGLGVQVVVDRQLTGADLDVRAVLGGGGALEPDQFQLVRLVGELLAGGLVGDDAAGEPLPALLDLLHLLLDGLEILRRERPGDLEVVVEAVLDRRADAQLGLGEDLLHGLGHDVRGGVAQDVQAVLGGDLHGLHGLAVPDLVGEVLELSGHPRGDHRAFAGEEVGGRSARRHHALFPLGIALDDHTDF